MQGTKTADAPLSQFPRLRLVAGAAVAGHVLRLLARSSLHDRAYKIRGLRIEADFLVFGRFRADVRLFNDRLSPDSGLGPMGIRIRAPGAGGDLYAAGPQCPGRPPVDQSRPYSVSAVGTGQAGADDDGGAL